MCNQCDVCSLYTFSHICFLSLTPVGCEPWRGEEEEEEEETPDARDEEEMGKRGGEQIRRAEEEEGGKRISSVREGEEGALRCQRPGKEEERNTFLSRCWRIFPFFLFFCLAHEERRKERESSLFSFLLLLLLGGEGG